MIRTLHPRALALLLLAGLGPVTLCSCGHHRHLSLRAPAPATPPVTSPAFAEALVRTCGTPWTTGNQISTLENGGVFYPVMLEAIQGARHSITFETFAFMSSTPAYYFSLALAERARAGVKVHMILDGIGSRNLGSTCENILRKAGVELHVYRPLNLLRPRYSNNRTHRKILVVDGKVGFIGGAGFADAWMGHAQSPERWRDTQYEIRGPAVAQLQRSFLDNWRELTGTELHGPAYFPEPPPAGPLRAQVTTAAPRDGQANVASSYLLAISAARKSLLIEHSYFSPNPTLLDALLDAARRGVRIELLVPGAHTDATLIRTLGRLTYPQLLDAGIRIWEYQPTMMHGKLIVVDNHLVIAGSANFDDRSFFINDENNLHVLSPAFAREQSAMFERDKAHSREITPAPPPLPPGKPPATHHRPPPRPPALRGPSQPRNTSPPQLRLFN